MEIEELDLNETDYEAYIPFNPTCKTCGKIGSDQTYLLQSLMGNTCVYSCNSLGLNLAEDETSKTCVCAQGY